MKTFSSCRRVFLLQACNVRTLKQTRCFKVCTSLLYHIIARMHFKSVYTFTDEKVGHIESGFDRSARVGDVLASPLEGIFLRVPLDSINWCIICCASVKKE